VSAGERPVSEPGAARREYEDRRKNGPNSPDILDLADAALDELVGVVEKQTGALNDRQEAYEALHGMWVTATAERDAARRVIDAAVVQIWAGK
jgi:hypothetical protein